MASDTDDLFFVNSIFLLICVFVCLLLVGRQEMPKIDEMSVEIHWNGDFSSLNRLTAFGRILGDQSLSCIVCVCVSRRSHAVLFLHLDLYLGEI